LSAKEDFLIVAKKSLSYFRVIMTWNWVITTSISVICWKTCFFRSFFAL